MHLPCVCLVLQHWGLRRMVLRKINQRVDWRVLTELFVSTSFLKGNSLGTLVCPHANCLCFCLHAPRSIKLEMKLRIVAGTEHMGLFCQKTSAVGLVFLFTSCSSTVAAIPHFSWYIKHPRFRSANDYAKWIISIALCIQIISLSLIVWSQCAAWIMHCTGGFWNLKYLAYDIMKTDLYIHLMKVSLNLLVLGELCQFKASRQDPNDCISTPFQGIFKVDEYFKMQHSLGCSF